MNSLKTIEEGIQAPLNSLNTTKDILRSPTNPETGVGGGACTFVLLDCVQSAAALPRSVIADSAPRSFWLDTFIARSETLRSMFLCRVSKLGPYVVCAATDCWP